MEKDLMHWELIVKQEDIVQEKIYLELCIRNELNIGNSWFQRKRS
jgi:hypothetical protein